METLSERFETIDDRDNDKPNYLDLDSDSDGIPDEIECGHQAFRRHLLIKTVTLSKLPRRF